MVCLIRNALDVLFQRHMLASSNVVNSPNDASNAAYGFIEHTISNALLRVCTSNTLAELALTLELSPIWRAAIAQEDVAWTFVTVHIYFTECTRHGTAVSSCSLYLSWIPETAPSMSEPVAALCSRAVSTCVAELVAIHMRPKMRRIRQAFNSTVVEVVEVDHLAKRWTALKAESVSCAWRIFICTEASRRNPYH